MNRINEFFAQSNFAKRTQYQKEIYLTTCFNFFKSIKTAENFLQIKPSEFKQLFLHLDKMQVLDSAKKRYRYALKNYADWLCSDLIANNQPAPFNYDFIFSNRFYTFRDSGTPSESHYLELKDVMDFLKWAKFTQPPIVFFAALVLATSGCRHDGVITLTRGNIDFTNRKFTMLEKSRDRGSKIKYYVMNKQIIEKLKEYISYLPETQDRIFAISQQKLNKRFKRWKSYMHAGLFRDSFNTILEENNVEEAIRDILQNRTPKSINAKHYLKKYSDWEKRVEKYDSIDPFFLCDLLN
jgi:integrase